MKTADVIKYYSRNDVREQILNTAKDREVIVRYRDKVGRRPNKLSSITEILNYVKDGATSFHGTLERWSDPLKITDNQKELDKLRIGWDLVFDIDGTHFKFSQVAAKNIVKAIRLHGIKNFSIKFSGRGGFHIGIPFESFPEKVGKIEITKYFPEGARIIAEYLSSIIEKPLRNEITKLGLDEVVKLSGKSQNEILLKDEINPFSLVEIDTIAIAQRHTFRLPYSLNEKSWLVSIPIEENHIMDFDFKEAKIENVNTEIGFLDKFKEGEAKRLFFLAFDFKKKEEKKIREIIRNYDYGKVHEANFPPCIKNMLKGLKDGRKRALFILMNFLKTMNWSYEEIEQTLLEWNKKNQPPLKENYVKTQLRWFKSKKTTYTPPSCDNSIYYKDIGVCEPDNICSKIKNPTQYPFKKMRKWKK